MFERLEQLLIDFDWKLNKHKKTSAIRKNQYSTTVGKTCHWMKPGKPFLPTVVMKNDPSIYNECKRLFPDFEFEMVVINKNFKCPPHKDKNNTQKSLIVGLGNYNGGDLIIENSETGETERHCILYSPLYFNGRDNTHYTDDYTGDRYTVILGNSKFRSHVQADKLKEQYSIAIPSYKRSETLKNKTLKFLQDHKINKNIIDIFVANEDEKKIYEQTLPKYYNKIIVARKGLINVRNFITNYYPENHKIVSIDDDINFLKCLTQEGYTSKDNDEGKPVYKFKEDYNLDDFITIAFDECKKTNLNLWGINPVGNPLVGKLKVSYDLKFIVGCFYGYINKKILLENIGEGDKEDFFRTIEYYKRDGGVIRFNNMLIGTNYYTEKGGLQADEHKIKKLDRMENDSNRLFNKYPDLVKVIRKKSRIFKDGYTDVKLQDKNNTYFKAKVKCRPFTELL